MPSLDYEMAAIMHKHLRDSGISLLLSDGVQSFQERDGRLVVKTEKGVAIAADFVLLSIGVRPEKRLAEKAGLNIGVRGGIEVDEYLTTSDPDIYAIGDAVEVRDLVSGGMRLLALAGPANRQGRAAADNAMGRRTPFDGVLGSGITRVLGMVAASTGAKEEYLRQIARPYLKSFTHPYNHATYYPGAKLMSMKLLFDPENGKILGAQIVGQEGADKRIDILATAMMAGMTVYDLERLELAYAPQFGSAKDPVNMAGFVAANILKGDVEVVHWDELGALDMEENLLLDVRTQGEVRQTGRIMDAVHIHVDELRDRLAELDRGKTYVVYCKVSQRAYIAYRILISRGFKARILSGGMETWAPVWEDMHQKVK